MSNPAYKIALRPQAESTLQRLSDYERERIIDALSDVARHEQPSSHPGVRALKGDKQGQLRLRVGNWRAVLELEKPDLLVHTIGDRDTIYND